MAKRYSFSKGDFCLLCRELIVAKEIARERLEIEAHKHSIRDKRISDPIRLERPTDEVERGAK
jgi:hypothetical protein